MEGNAKKQIIKTTFKLLLHLILICCICIYIFFAFVLGPYDDSYIGQKVISEYRLEFCIKACLTGGIINAVIAWLSFKKVRLFCPN